MKLYWSLTSPYVRKVMACAITREIDGRITLVPTNPHLSTPDLLTDNPLSKVPTLLTDDGLALFDSPVICEYLDSLGDAPPMFPPSGAARWRALKLQAMGDGILDAAVGRRMEQAKPEEAARTAWMERQQAAIGRALAMLETDLPGHAADIGSLSIGCALGYLDFRFAAEPWRDACPALAAWFAGFSATPGLMRTIPKDAS